MISGFNTDIEFDGTVYHVQTEDKGLQKRVIMSLVYDKGTILASKRESYDDLAVGNFDTKALTDRVGRQHKLICAAIRAGRISELKQMSSKPVAGVRSGLDAVRAEVPLAPAVPARSIPITVPVPTVVQRPVLPVAPPLVQENRPRFENVPQRPPIKIAIVETGRAVPAIPAVAAEPVVEVMRIIEDHPILSADAVAVVSELSGQERPVNAKLSLELLGDAKFKGGDRRTVNIMICRGTSRRVVADAQIMVKVVGSSFRPVIFHAKSDANGLAKVHMQLPHFQAGRAALLIRAMTEGEEIELRRVVTPG